MKSLRFSIRFLVLSLSVGCGETQIATYPVSGTVAFDNGSPVRTGTIELFSPEHGLTATGKIRENGSFELGTYSSNDGACAGDHKVIVTQLIINDGTVKHSKDHGMPVDPVFASYNTSTLTATIKEQEKNILRLNVTARQSFP